MRSSRRLAAGALVAFVVLVGAALVFGGSRAARRAPTGPQARVGPAPVAPRLPTAAPGFPVPRRSLAVGLDEANANLLWSAAARPVVPAPFQASRAELSALHPAYLRLVLDWAKVAPSATSPVALDGPADGCVRGLGPCAAYAGVHDEFAAIASQQRTQGGFTPVIVIDGVPSWASAPASGCERGAIGPTSRPIAVAALGAYRALIRSLLALGRAVGLALPWWSPWNEPNHPFFISPQRAACTRSSRALSPGVYSELAGAMSAELHADGAVHHMLLGELAGFTSSGARDTSIGEFVGDLPAGLLCLGSVWTVHAYARRGAAVHASGPVGELEDALRRRGGCSQRARIWVTETGAGAPHAGLARPAGAADERTGCRALAAQLLRWYDDPRVDAVFQYTFREDNLFPVGLADVGLTRLYPSYFLWKAWGGSRAPGAPPPGLPPQCA